MSSWRSNTADSDGATAIYGSAICDSANRATVTNTSICETAIFGSAIRAAAAAAVVLVVVVVVVVDGSDHIAVAAPNTFVVVVVAVAVVVVLRTSIMVLCSAIWEATVVVMFAPAPNTFTFAA